MKQKKHHATELTKQKTTTRKQSKNFENFQYIFEKSEKNIGWSDSHFLR